MKFSFICLLIKSKELSSMEFRIHYFDAAVGEALFNGFSTYSDSGEPSNKIITFVVILLKNSGRECKQTDFIFIIYKFRKS